MQKTPQTCPYLDLADVRCGGRLTMHSLSEAYRLCFGHPEACPVHQMLAAERADACDEARMQEAGVA